MFEMSKDLCLVTLAPRRVGFTELLAEPLEAAAKPQVRIIILNSSERAIDVGIRDATIPQLLADSPRPPTLFLQQVGLVFGEPDIVERPLGL
jgi:hypothetical protein